MLFGPDVPRPLRASLVRSLNNCVVDKLGIAPFNRYACRTPNDDGVGSRSITERYRASVSLNRRCARCSHVTTANPRFVAVAVVLTSNPGASPEGVRRTLALSGITSKFHARSDLGGAAAAAVPIFRSKWHPPLRSRQGPRSSTFSASLATFFSAVPILARSPSFSCGISPRSRCDTPDDATFLFVLPHRDVIVARSLLSAANSLVDSKHAREF